MSDKTMRCLINISDAAYAFILYIVGVIWSELIGILIVNYKLFFTCVF